MFFGEIKTELSIDALLSVSLILNDNLKKIKISKGTKIDKKIIDADKRESSDNFVSISPKNITNPI